MRLSHLLFVCLVGISSLVACGGGKDGGGGGGSADAAVDSPPPIDSPPPVQNALGQLCPFAAGGMGQPCPAGNACVTLQGLGSTTTGYCTPDCMNMTTLCTTGYTGPAGGMPQCALTTAAGQPPNGCAIVCTDNAQCPTGLSCLQVPMNTVKICVPPA
ncbi:MAG TPA: hypothetical protein VFQ53_21090 [Kofleriaceae bacterium]|nr:hypothetical protein [Kofleriaceae bacterium]